MRFFFKHFGLIFVPVLACFVIASAYRLARFNCRTQGNKKSHFEGLPTTSAGGICAAMVLVAEFLQKNGVADMDENVSAMSALVMIIALSLLMVSTIRFKTINSFFLWDSHRILNGIVIIFFAVFFFCCPAVALFLLGLWYIGESLISRYLSVRIEENQHIPHSEPSAE